jgi:hypothetical protein
MWSELLVLRGPVKLFSPYVSNYGLWKPYQRVGEAEAEFFFIFFSVKSYLSTFSRRMRNMFCNSKYNKGNDIGDKTVLKMKQMFNNKFC